MACIATVADMVFTCIARECDGRPIVYAYARRLPGTTRPELAPVGLISVAAVSRVPEEMFLELLDGIAVDAKTDP